MLISWNSIISRSGKGVSLLLVVLLGSIHNSFAATRTSVAGAVNWNNVASWVEGFIPTGADDVIISAGSTVTVDLTGMVCLSVTINNTGTLSWAAANTLTVGTGGVTIDVGGTWNNSGNAAISIAGSIAQNGTFSSGTASYTLSGAAQTFTGATIVFDAISMTGTYTNNMTSYLDVNTTFSGAGTLTMGASSKLQFAGVTLAVGINATTNTPNTIEYDGNVAQTPKATTYWNLNVNNSAAALDVNQAGGSTIVVNNDVNILDCNVTRLFNCSVAGNVNISSGAQLRHGTGMLPGDVFSVGGTMTVNGTYYDNDVDGTKIHNNIVMNSGSTWNNNVAEDFTINGDFTFNGGTFTSNTGIYYFAGAGKTISGAGTYTITNVYIPGTISYTGTGLVVGTDLKVTAPGTFTNNSTITVSSTISGTGSFIQGTGSTLNLGMADPLASLTISTLDFSTNSNTIGYTRAGNQNIMSNSYKKLSISGSGIKTLANTGAVTVNENLSVAGSATLECDIYQITGNATGTFTMASGTSLTLGRTTDGTNVLFPTAFTTGNITLNATSTVLYQSDGNQTVSGNPTYGHLTISGGASTVSKTAAASFNVSGNLNVSNATSTFVVAANTVSVTGTATITGAADITTGTLQVTGATTVSAATGDVNITGSGSFKPTGALTVNNTVDFTSNGTLVAGAAMTIAATGTLNLGAAVATVAGNATVTGVVNISTGSLSVTGTTTETAATGDINVTGTGAFNPGGACTINNTVDFTGAGTMTAGSTITVAAGATLSLGTAVATSAGNVAVTGTVTISSGTLTVTGNVSSTGDITFSAGGLLALTGNFSNSGTFTPATSTVKYIGGGAQTVKATGYYNLTVDNAGGTATLSADATASNMVTMTAASGTFVISGGGTNLTGAAGVTAVGGTIQIGTNIVAAPGLPELAGAYSITAGTIDFSRAGGQYIRSTTFYNIICSGSGTKTIAGNITVNGNLTVNNSVSLSSDQYQIIGNATGTFSLGSASTLTLGNAGVASAVQFPTLFITANITLDNTSTVDYRANTAQTISSTPSSYGHLSCITSGTKTLAGPITVNGNFTTSGTSVVDCVTYQITGNAAGTFTLGNGTGLILGLATNVTNVDFPTLYTTGNISLGSTSNVTYASNVAQTIRAVTYGDLTVSGGAATVNKTPAASFSIARNLSVSAATVTFPVGTFSVSVTGTSTFTGKCTISTGTLSATGAVTMNNDLTITGAGLFAAAAAVTVSAGNLINDAGTTTIGTNLVITATPSMLRISTGTVTVTGAFGAGTGDLTFTSNGVFNIAGNYTNSGSFTKSTGTVRYNGSAAQTGRPANYYNLVINNTAASGTNVTFAGATDVQNLLDIQDGQMLISAGTSNLTGSGLTMTAGTELLIQTTNTVNIPQLTGVVTLASTSKITFSRGGVQNILGTFGSNGASYQDVEFANTSLKTLQSALSVLGNLTISGTAGLDVKAGSNFAVTLQGNWINNSTLADPFREQTGTVTLSGANAQAITCVSVAGGETFRNLVINKSANVVTLNDPITISGAATFTQGIVFSTSSDLFIFADNATSNGGDPDSYVDGPVKKTGDDAFPFPIGDGNYWGRVGIGAPSVVTDEFTAQYFEAGFGSYSVTQTPNPIDHVSTLEYWTLDRTTGTSNVAVTLYWEDASVSAIKNCSDLRIAHWNSGSSVWENNNNVVSVTSSGCPTPTTQSGNIVTSAAVSSFSPFTFASSAGPNPLPVEFLSLSATPTGNQVDIDWSTAVEMNSDYFMVQRSPDGIVFDDVAPVKAAGYSSIVKYYSLIDEAPLSSGGGAGGEVYYRLKQFDLDGKFSYSAVVAVNMKGQGVDVFPNPSTGLVNLYLKGEKNEPVVITLTDVLGREMFVQSILLPEDNAVLPFDFTGKLRAGVYTLSTSSAAERRSAKLVIR